MHNGPIVIIDDDDALRDSLAFLLGTNGFKTNSYKDARSFFDDIANVKPSCIITDVRMPGMTGIELVRQLKQRRIDTPVIVITGHGDVALAVSAMKAGACDFLEKPFDESVLLPALRFAINSAQNASMRSDLRSDAEKMIQSLSGREKDVLAGLIAGRTNKMIAIDLDISPRTVEVYRANIMSKTQSKTMSDLMRLALAAGM